MSEEGKNLVDWAEEVIKDQRDKNPQIFETIDIVKEAQKGIDIYNQYLEIINQSPKIITTNKTFHKQLKSNKT